MAKTIALVISEVFLRRLTPALEPFVRREQVFRVVNIRRPIGEIEALLREMRPDGILTEWLPEVTEQLVALGFPTVIADTDLTYPGAASIDVEDFAVGREAALAFLDGGFHHFACLGNDTPYSHQRIAGFTAAIPPGTLAGRFITRELDGGDYGEHFRPAPADLRRWLRDLPKPVAIFAVHDPLGRYLCEACQSEKIDIPGSVAVIGANNDAMVCGLTFPTLSSVLIPWEKIGALAGETIVAMMNGRPAPTAPALVSPGSVVHRDSASHLAVDDPMLRRIMIHFTAHLHEPLTVGEVCGQLRVPRRAAERRFRERFRKSPAEILTGMRIARARELLLKTHHPMPMVAELSGFSSPEHMAHVFRRRLGAAPSHYRRGTRERTSALNPLPTSDP